MRPGMESCRCNASGGGRWRDGGLWNICCCASAAGAAACADGDEALDIAAEDIVEGQDVLGRVADADLTRSTRRLANKSCPPSHETSAAPVSPVAAIVSGDDEDDEGIV